MGFRPNRLAKTATAFTPNAGAIVATTVRPATFQRQAITEDVIKDPESLKQALLAMQDATKAATQNTSPFSGGVVLASEDGVTQGINFVAGTPKVINHRLGHKPDYVAVLSAWVATPQFFRLDQTDVEDAVSIKLQFTNTCRVKLWVGP